MRMQGREREWKDREEKDKRTGFKITVGVAFKFLQIVRDRESNNQKGVSSTD